MDLIRSDGVTKENRNVLEKVCITNFIITALLEFYTQMALPYAVINHEPFDGDVAVGMPFETVRTKFNKSAYVV